jgi:tetratricopeptide (TPR) repeat protein
MIMLRFLARQRSILKLIVVLFAIILIPSCVRNISEKSDMKSILQEIAVNAVYPNYLNDHDGAIKDLQSIINTCKDDNQRVNYKYVLADEYLRNGETNKAIQTLEEILQYIISHPDFFTDANISFQEINEQTVRRDIAIALFRASEEANCQSVHNETSCIIPFLSTAVHSRADYGYKSFRVLKELVDKDPKDMQSVWLLNIVNAAIGQPLDSMPKGLRIDFARYSSPHPIGKFKNTVLSRKADFPELAGGAIVEDFDNDGFYDIIVSSCDPKRDILYYRNNGRGTFEDYTQKANLIGIKGGLNMTHCDYNNDGYADLFIMRGGWFEGYGNYPNSLLRNNGDGTFTDVTIAVGLLSFHPTHSVVWHDFNRDGWLDLFVGNETSNPADPHPSQFYISDGKGSFIEVTEKSGLLMREFVKGVTTIDFDNDGWMDLYVSCSGGRNKLFKNLGVKQGGIPSFKDVSVVAGIQDPIESFSCLTADINNDGWDDLFVMAYNPQYTLNNIAAEYLGISESAYYPRVYINNRNGTFKEASRQFGVRRSLDVMGLGMGDIDNDGYIDFYLGTGQPSFSGLYPNILFRNQNGEAFQDITMQTHMGHLQKGHQVAMVDFDNDGYIEIYANMGGFFKADFAYNVFFDNPGGNNNFVKVVLHGVVSDRKGIGARLTVEFEEKGEVRRVFKTVSVGTSFGSSNFRQHIGVGQASQIKSLTVEWPATGKKVTFKDLEVNHQYYIKEDSREFKKTKLQMYSKEIL